MVTKGGTALSGGGGRWINQEFGISRNKLLYIKQITKSYGIAQATILNNRKKKFNVVSLLYK